MTIQNQSFEQSQQHPLSIGVPTLETLQRIDAAGALLETQDFHDWFFSSDARFDWATPTLLDRLRMEALESMPNNISEVEHIRGIAQECRTVAQGLAGALGIQLGSPGLEKAAGERYAALVSKYLGFVLDREFIVQVDDGESIGDKLGGLFHYAECRQTLALDTGHPAFERILAGLDAEYMSNGNPSLLLGSFGNFARNRKAGVAIALSADACGGFWLANPKTVARFEAQIKSGVNGIVLHPFC